MMSKRAKTWFTILMVVITVLMVFPLLWMLMMSFKSNAEIMSDPLSWPKALNWDNYRNALKTLSNKYGLLNTDIRYVYNKPYSSLVKNIKAYPYITNNAANRNKYLK